MSKHAELDAFFELHDQGQYVALQVHRLQSRDWNGGMLAEEQKGMPFIIRRPRRHAVLDDEFVSNADDIFVSVLNIARKCLFGRFNIVDGRKRAGEVYYIAEIRERESGCRGAHVGNVCADSRRNAYKESNEDGDWGCEEANSQESRCTNCSGGNSYGPVPPRWAV